jgi:RHS repeat-associated protein
VGNRLTMNNSGVVTYTYDANNKLTQLVGPGGTTTFGYDNNGNTTSMTVPGPITTTYGYDYENRLTSVTAPSYTAAYTYAADGVRLRAQESNHAYPDRWFQYDGARPVLEGTLSGDTFTTLNRYVLEGNSYYDPLISASIGGQNRYYLYDGLGSTRQLLDSSQTVTDTYQYEAFGNLMGSTGSTPNPYRYVGSLGYYQTGSSLMHLGARYYLPEVGRFTARDAVADPGANAYHYALNNPVLATDPTGLEPAPWCKFLCDSVTCPLICSPASLIQCLPARVGVYQACMRKCRKWCYKLCEWEPNPVNYEELCKNDPTIDCCNRVCRGNQVCLTKCYNWVSSGGED